MRPKVWIQSATPPKCNLSASRKTAYKEKVETFLEEVYKPKRIAPPPASTEFNFATDAYVKWRGPYLIVTAVYACPSPNAISPSFDWPLARFGYFRDDEWSLWARRHNEQWMDLQQRLTLDACLNALVEDPWFDL